MISAGAAAVDPEGHPCMALRRIISGGVACFRDTASHVVLHGTGAPVLVIVATHRRDGVVARRISYPTG